MSTVPQSSTRDSGRGISRAETRVVVASSLGTVFEWYDFFLYAILAPLFAELFFPPDNYTAALLSAFAIYAAGFLARPFGALLFGRIGDRLGRKYTFLVTILVMGLSTFLVGLLPTYASVGWFAPALLAALRLVQGLALGGEYGGAAIYVAEHAAPGRRGYDTGWVQTTATLGLLLALAITGLGQFGGLMTPADFAEWGWRLPFLLSIVLLIFSIYVRLRLQESPVFQRMKAEGRGSDAPLAESLRHPNGKYVLLALLGATAGQGVVWYTGQLYALFFLQITLRVDLQTTYLLIGSALLLGAPLFVLFGWLSDRIGRRKIILAGMLLAAATYVPLFQALTQAANPALAAYQATHTITVAAKDCAFHVFVGPWSTFSDCDKAKDFLVRNGLSFRSVDLPPDAAASLVTRIGETRLEGWDEASYATALQLSGYPSGGADHRRIDWVVAIAVLFVLVVYVAMVYGPIAALLVEMFPARIRYTSMSLPYHLGNGWFGGILPLLATALVVVKGDIYYGLWYPITVAAATFVVGLLFLRDRRDVDLHAADRDQP